MFTLSIKPRSEPQWCDFPGLGTGPDGAVVRVLFDPCTDFARTAAVQQARGLLPHRGEDEGDADWLDAVAAFFDRQGFRVSDAALADPERRLAALASAHQILTDRILFLDLARAWTGVGTVDGEGEAEITPATVRAFLDAYDGYARGRFRVFLSDLSERLAAEGNGSAPLPNGSAGEGAPTAGTAVN